MPYDRFHQPARERNGFDLLRRHGQPLLIGVPAYHSDSLVHDAAAETVWSALRGVRLAVSGKDLNGREFGIAMYIDYTATRTDWLAYAGARMHRR